MSTEHAKGQAGGFARQRFRDRRRAWRRRHWCGHESPAFTLKQYAHVIPGMQAAAAALVAERIKEHGDAA
jgi:hypothetical protein